MEYLPVIVNFALVVGILFFSTRKAVSQFLVTRSTTIGDEIQEAEKLYGKAHADLTLWETNWRSCEAHSKQMFDEAEANLGRQREQELTRAKAEANRIRQEAQMVGASESQKSLRWVRKEWIEKTLGLVSQFLGSHLNDEDRHNLVNEYVEIAGNGKSKSR
jgi:F0F1-type ATP synthase membrane subunit b/b'